MTLHLAPYVHYPNNDCADAFAFYGTVFEVEPTILRGKDMGDTNIPELVVHAQLKIADGVAVYGSDDCMGQKLAPQGFEVCIFTDDEQQGRRWFEALVEGGEVYVPFKKQDWGDVYGQTRDRFGLTWAINVSES